MGRRSMGRTSRTHPCRTVDQVVGLRRGRFLGKATGEASYRQGPAPSGGSSRFPILTRATQRLLHLRKFRMARIKPSRPGAARPPPASPAREASPPGWRARGRNPGTQPESGCASPGWRARGRNPGVSATLARSFAPRPRASPVSRHNKPSDSAACPQRSSSCTARSSPASCSPGNASLAAVSQRLPPLADARADDAGRGRCAGRIEVGVRAAARGRRWSAGSCRPREVGPVEQLATAQATAWPGSRVETGAPEAPRLTDISELHGTLKLSVAPPWKTWHKSEYNDLAALRPPPQAPCPRGSHRGGSDRLWKPSG